MKQMSNFKIQMTNKCQIPKSKRQNVWLLVLGVCILFGAWYLVLGNSAWAFAQAAKMPHGDDVATGVINGALLKDGKTPLAGQIVTLEILNGHAMVLSIPKPTDKAGKFQFKNIFKSKEFTYSISTEYEGKIYRTEFISLAKNEKSKKVDLIVGAGAKEGPALPPAVEAEQMGDGKSCEHKGKFSEYQLLAIVLSIAAVVLVIYQRKRAKKG